MTDNTTGPQSNDDAGDSFRSHLRDAGQAWVNAGARLGDVVSDFAGRFRDGSAAEPASGAHAKPDPVSEERTTAGRFRVAAGQASDRLRNIRGTDDLKNTTSDFAGHAEDIIRDVAGNVRQAASGTRDSGAATDARAALSDAVASVRDSFDEAVEAVQERRRQAGENNPDADSMIADLRARLDDLIERAGSLSRDEGTPSTTNAGSGQDPDIIEGELISEDTPEDRRNNEKDS